MNEEEKKIIEKFVEKCNKFDESVEIKGVSVGEEYRILETVCKTLDLVEKLQKENEEFEEINNELEAEKNEAIRRYNFETIPIQKVKDKIEYLEDYIKILIDERDKIKQEYDRDTHILQNQLDLANAKNIEKDKIIDLMAKYIGEIDDETFCDEDKYERDIEDNVIGCDEDCQECVKQYFENKVKEG